MERMSSFSFIEKQTNSKWITLNPTKFPFGIEFNILWCVGGYNWWKHTIHSHTSSYWKTISNARPHLPHTRYEAMHGKDYFWNAITIKIAWAHKTHFKFTGNFLANHFFLPIYNGTLYIHLHFHLTWRNNQYNLYCVPTFYRFIIEMNGVFYQLVSNVTLPSGTYSSVKCHLTHPYHIHK